MKAAVVSAFEGPPRYGDFAEPVVQEDEVLVHVQAAALSQLVRSQAAGTHYSRSPQFPFVPGADGVGRLADGSRVYFAFPRAPIGSMAERVAVKRAYCVALPDDLPDASAAAAANPGMSSWAALIERAALRDGETVLVNGAAGASGRLAVQIAKHLGAARVVATARDASSEHALRELGADAFIALNQAPELLTDRLRRELLGVGVDIVLDYLWGPPAACILAAAASHGEQARRIRFVQIGAMAGASIPFPAMALRSSALELTGSGLGSVSHEALVGAAAGFLRAYVPAKFACAYTCAPLRDVASVWQQESKARLILTL